MKKLLLAVALFPLALNAQRAMWEYYSLSMLVTGTENNFCDEKSAPLSLRKQLKVKSIQSTYTRKNGKQSVSKTEYNAQGRITRLSSRRTEASYTYEHDTLQTGTVSSYRGKTFTSASAYENGRLVSRENHNNGKLTAKIAASYNAQGNILRSQMKQGRRNYEIQYTYGEDGKMTRNVYLVNGKVKKEWIYECKPEGEVVASKTEAVSSFCTYREESADGSFVKFTRSLQEGKPYLTKQTFSKDSVLIQSQRFLNETTLIWESKNEGNTETVISYKDSGKLRYTQITVFNDKGSVISREYFEGKKKKHHSKSVFELNADGTTKSATSYRKGKQRSSTIYEYSFH